MIEGPRPYPAYKNSGQAWLGPVPQHWSVLPHRALFAEVLEREHPDEQMLSVTITQGVIKQRQLLAGGSKKDGSKQDKSAYKLLCPGDLAYNKMRAWQGALGISELRGIISPAYVVQRLRADGNPRYFHYLFRTPGFAKEAERWSYGITSDMWSLRPEHFKAIYSAIPTGDEQAAIVRFLDHTIHRLDKAIRAKRKTIALLNEQKQAIIHRAVTRGLDPDMPLKDSGIPWLGQIPAHWDVWRIGRFARVGNGSTPSRARPDYWIGGTYPWLNSSQVNRACIDHADQFVTQAALRECHLPRVPAGSVLVAITGQGKTRGMAAVLEIESTINQHLAFITPSAPIATPQFIHVALSAAYQPLRALSDDSGSTKGALTCKDLKTFKIAIPPKHEQARLLTHIESETRSLAKTSARLGHEVDLLCEYRTRLIADVVTGQLDVREAAARLTGEIEAPIEAQAEAAFAGIDEELAETEP